MAELIVRAPDGTKISSESYGQGRPLVIVSGAMFARERWLSVIPLFASERDPYVIDRRGRGRSGDTQPYAPEREIEDIVAVIERIGEPLDLLGHSSGAILALQVAARAPAQLERVIAYEPPIFFKAEDSIVQDLPERLDALLAAGKREAAVETFFREGPRMSDQEIQSLKAAPFWPQLVATLGHTVPYDSRVQRSFKGERSELESIRVPTLMLVGSASSPRMQSGARTIAERLSHAQIAELAEQQHMAHVTAPALFAATVNGFLSAAAS
ncbi:MAG TPA: alpha/beta hydrolase [Polyangiaceae bacterium]|jgi:pimeloyl-ACP methyl ester carboxylesterase|nr:alpha/beta hydrolase [Polyangiaceae bacterium]